MPDIESTKVILEVLAGLIPDMPMPEYTRQFSITSSQWEKPEEVMKVYGYAQEYNRTLWHPGKVNWVTLTWIYL